MLIGSNEITNSISFTPQRSKKEVLKPLNIKAVPSFFQGSVLYLLLVIVKE